MAIIEDYYKELQCKKRGLNPTALALDLLTSYEELQNNGFSKYIVCVDRGRGVEQITIEVKIEAQKTNIKT